MATTTRKTTTKAATTTRKPATKAAAPKAPKTPADRPGVLTVETRIGMIEYTEVETPASAVSAGADNPHIEGARRAKVLMATPDRSLTLVVAEAEVQKHVAWLRRAANAEGFTMRIVESAPADGKVTLTFRGTEKITRQRKPKEDAATEGATEAATA